MVLSVRSGTLQDMVAIKRCSACKREQPVAAFAKNQGTCRACQKKYREANKERFRERDRARWKAYDAGRMTERALRQIASRQADPDKHRDAQLRSKYGISLADQQTLLQAQGGGCGICSDAAATRLHQDHCHTTGLHRGVLCQPCNHVVGHFRENTEFILTAVDYLHTATVQIEEPFAGPAARAILASSGDLTDAMFEAEVQLCPQCQRRHPVTHFVKGVRGRFGAQGRCSDCRGLPPLAPEVALLRVTKYGIPAWQQIVLDVAFGNRCAICSLPDVHRAVLHTDHDHGTGLIRGLLCGRCNRGLGAASDSPQTLLRAVEYLSEWRQRHEGRLAQNVDADAVIA